MTPDLRTRITTLMCVWQAFANLPDADPTLAMHAKKLSAWAHVITSLDLRSDHDELRRFFEDANEWQVRANAHAAITPVANVRSEVS